MPGSGKTSAALYASELGYPIVTMGDVIREMAEKLGLPATIESLASLMLEIRSREGANAVAKRCIPLIRAKKSPIVIVDGIRNIEEVNEFRKYFQVFMIALLCPQELRFLRLFKRKRSDDPDAWREFAGRDDLELRVGVGTVIAIADSFISNEGTKDELKSRVQDIVREFAKELRS